MAAAESRKKSSLHYKRSAALHLTSSPRYETASSRTLVEQFDLLKPDASTPASWNENMTRLRKGMVILNRSHPMEQPPEISNIARTTLDDMHAAAVEFIEVFKSSPGKMNWGACWAEGQKKGLFRNYGICRRYFGFLNLAWSVCNTVSALCTVLSSVKCQTQ